MPIKEAMKAHKVTATHLIPSLLRDLKKGGRSVRNTTIITKENDITVVAGGAVSIGDAVTIASDGKAYKASNVTADNKPADGVAITIGSSGSGIKVRLSGTVLAYTGLTPGKVAYLGAGSPNVTTTLPTFTAGHLFQRLGVVISPTEIFLDIEEASSIL